jgi:hypothetical protein
VILFLFIIPGKGHILIWSADVSLICEEFSCGADLCVRRVKALSFVNTATQMQAALDPADDPPSSSNNDEWYNWVVGELSSKPSWSKYRETMLRCVKVAGERWRPRFSREDWIRTMKKDRLLKELNEIAPVLDRLLKELKKTAYSGQRTTIVDLCSGFGYLGMFIAELAPKEKLERIVLVDYAFAPFGQEPQTHHINNKHILNNQWPTPLQCFKVDLKKISAVENFRARVVAQAPGPVITVAVHLCGVLSLRAVQLFNDSPSMTMLALKPCCLPPLYYVTHHAPKSGLPVINWSIRKPCVGGVHSIPAKEVCSAGQFVKNVWRGPPRNQIRSKFQRWAAHLTAAVDVEAETMDGGGGTEGVKRLEEITVQQSHWQNLFIFAHRRRQEERGTATPLVCENCESVDKHQRPKSGVNSVHGRLVRCLRMRLDRERARSSGGNAVAPASAAGAGSGASASAVFQCRVCEQGFATRNKLFKHIVLTGHGDKDRNGKGIPQLKEAPVPAALRALGFGLGLRAGLCAGMDDGLGAAVGNTGILAGAGVNAAELMVGLLQADRRHCVLDICADLCLGQRGSVVGGCEHAQAHSEAWAQAKSQRHAHGHTLLLHAGLSTGLDGDGDGYGCLVANLHSSGDSGGGDRVDGSAAAAMTATNVGVRSAARLLLLAEDASRLPCMRKRNGWKVEFDLLYYYHTNILLSY